MTKTCHPSRRVVLGIKGTLTGFARKEETVKEAMVRLAFEAEQRINQKPDLRFHLEVDDD